MKMKKMVRIKGEREGAREGEREKEGVGGEGLSSGGIE